MSSAGAALASWQARPGLALLLFATAALYGRGWLALRRQMPRRFGVPRLLAFLAGLTAVAGAAASPLDAFAGLLLQVHMAQHLLLMMVAPPLLWLGAPAIPLLRGLPERWAKSGLGPFLAWPLLQRVAGRLAHPVVAWPLFAATLVVWHLPGPYQLALREPLWHEVEHAMFLGAGLLFWWPVVQPWPSQPAWPRWMLIPYLLLADALNTALSALFIFSGHLLYPSYATVPRLLASTPMDDQAVAGALMWVPGSVLFLVPVVLIVIELLSGRTALPIGDTIDHLITAPTLRRRSGARQGEAWRFDLLRLPVLGPLLRWRYGRRAVQLAMLALAAAVVVDGLVGPQMAPMNLAGVLPWTYWRAFAVVALLVAGNLFCFACPFMLPRQLGKRWFAAQRPWPRWLRTKWLAASLLVAYLWSYEALAPWDRPWATSLLVLAYFSAAFAVDAVFRGAAFCKHVCPIGQFHFVQSLASPLSVAARDASTCRACTSHDCIRGNAHQRGCELELFLPEKHGNLDCTFCLDCVAACPHDNVGIIAATPIRDLTRDPHRASIGRLSERPDLAALILLLVFAAFSNAAAMVAPVSDWSTRAAARLGLAGSDALAGAAMLLALIGVPIVAAAAAAKASQLLGATRTPLGATIGRFAPALVPLGLSMWTAHFLFHFWTAAPALRPVLQRVAAELGGTVLGTPAWAASAPMAAAGDLTALELALLDVGLLITLYALWRIAVHDRGRGAASIVVAAPWAALALALWAAGAWIVFQPMAMRGMMH